ncbi:TBC domain-containing protein -like protein [Emericellopsis cladophorae]|uniref:TBC domain-containing protein -like protein n=1 Tax=Emericellopsis cladophorae TaxID=2686198 RepID=A0A9P9Y8G1_9HYPO|nr:TBC domain-containing protein -like protein [Emericellopsis cladophorae]KAI6785396.1 TBC domain-containing protein -like protein [Emericellopsis cladophorae]
MSSRSGSVRQKNRPAVRRPSFRDEYSLVGIRYEKTSQGEMPIPITTINPVRSPSRPTSSESSASSGACAITGGSLIIVRPRRTAPSIDEHPALRTRKAVQQQCKDVWKRDSGHGANSLSSSTPTIDEEDGEDGSLFDRHSALLKKHRLSSVCVSGSGSPAVLPADHNHLRQAKQGKDQAHNHVASDMLACRVASDTSVLPSRSPSVSAPSSQSPPKKLARGLSIRSIFSITNSPRLSATARSASTPMRDQVTPEPVREPLIWGYPSPEAAITSASDEPNKKTPSTPISTPKVAARESIGSSSPKSQPQQRDSVETIEATHYSPLDLSLPPDGLLDDGFLASLSFSQRGSVMFGGQRALALDDATMAHQSTSHAQPPLEDPRTSVDNDPKPSPSPATNLSPSATPVSETIPGSGTPASDATPDTGHATPDASTQGQTSEPERPAEPQSQTQSEPPPQAQQSTQYLNVPSDIRLMEPDLEKESRKVRSLYAADETPRWEDGALPSLSGRTASPIEEVSPEEDENDPSHGRLGPVRSTPCSGASSSLRPSSAYKTHKDSGVNPEDGDDFEGVELDRYGFIRETKRPNSSRVGTPTEMKSALFSPRRGRNVLQKRDASGVGSPLGTIRRPPSRKVSARSLNTQHSELSTTSFRSQRSAMRHASNLLPHNRDRRWMDEAGDMLTVSPSLQNVAEEAQVEKISEALKRKEWERSEKWQKMAKNIKKGAQGEGMEFEFDAKNPKLIERTWKGIPDRWRTAAWWSFLDTSAKNHPNSRSVDEIIAEFHKLQLKPSPDDVQIDLDVPRTIGRHIMFRRRYQGGQRLLFRVLHAISIYFPETGYVQGMASLAATLLCYFEEEKCFVMMVRMWELRGLDRLYRHGFEGLMTGLQEFEMFWLNKDVAKKLTELGIDPTAYGTKWYLTLFNLSLPFPAQLRVWDVIMLLGTSGEREMKPTKKATKTLMGPPTGLDVLHATSAALIHAMRELLLDSDFENAMKALTSFVTIKDEDLLMKVTKAEWKARQGKRRS